MKHSLQSATRLKVLLEKYNSYRLYDYTKMRTMRCCFSCELTLFLKYCNQTDNSIHTLDQALQKSSFKLPNCSLPLELYNNGTNFAAVNLVSVTMADLMMLFEKISRFA